MTTTRSSCHANMFLLLEFTNWIFCIHTDHSTIISITINNIINNNVLLILLQLLIIIINYVKIFTCYYGYINTNSNDENTNSNTDINSPAAPTTPTTT